MKRVICFLFSLNLFFVHAQDSVYQKYPVYNGTDLGLTYTPFESKFRIWAPTAEKAQLLFYDDGEKGVQTGLENMEKSAGGTWVKIIKEDLLGKFYTFRVMIDGKWMNDVPDPYTKAVGVNGKRAMVINLDKTNPDNWEKDKSPLLKKATDAIIYELHVRDASIDENSGIKNKGKFLGLTEAGTKNDEGLSTGLDHLKELGVTDIHLLPCFDFNSVDETQLDKPQYNWGYDPLNYNVPEGSYSTNPYDGMTRIKEFKELVQSFHKNGLRVIMDVVYNHTALTENSYFNQLVPGYYYRQTADGKFSNATACGNEIASERPMVRKFILESVKYWVQQYHVDGFRFDLMGVMDIQTMNLISKELHRMKPGILLYGEGWTSGDSPFPDSLRALKKNAYRLDRIAVFSDDIRDAIKGSVFDLSDRGFVSGKPGMEPSIHFGVVASCKHSQVDYSKVNYSKAPYAAGPFNTITYCECHDNNTLWDKLALSATNASESERREMQKLSLAIILTSQGISFLHAGTEFLRSKKGVENSFNTPDSINEIDWRLKSKNGDVFQLVKALIEMRKQHPAFRMTTDKEIARNINFEYGVQNAPGVVTYLINGKSVHDPWKKILVAFNGRGEQTISLLPEGTWKTYIQNNIVMNGFSEKDKVVLDPHSCTILYQ
ncbi:MAG: type I pullulanase [Bacteroidetes bacterium]|nr:type I pullulanase [Bacteroidota bacterium]MBS1931739.1 type I pullulanase [Bacteroidota bacterium]